MGGSALGVVDRKVATFGEQVSPGSWFLSKLADIDEYPALLPYSHYLRQAWEELTLGGVLCVDGRPTVYLCAGSQFTAEIKRKNHSFVWNQGLVPLLMFLTPDHVEVHSTVEHTLSRLAAEGSRAPHSSDAELDVLAGHVMSHFRGSARS